MTKQRSKFHPIYNLLVFLGISFFLSGCATNLDSTVAPGVNLQEIKTLFVQKLPADSRGVEKIIAEQLNKMGYQAAYGPELPQDQSFDALVTYQDKWMWDITMS